MFEHLHCRDELFDPIQYTIALFQSQVRTIDWYLFENKKHWPQFESVLVALVVFVVGVVVAEPVLELELNTVDAVEQEQPLLVRLYCLVLVVPYQPVQTDHNWVCN
jgi:hypothetical protein|tara:strand:+ start:416 stop:733 length:318 start_codon:yes stop_codon:yes gene_type:complete